MPRKNSNRSGEKFETGLGIPRSIVLRDDRRTNVREIFEWVDKGVVSSTSAANGYYAFYFTLNDLQDVSSYTSTFDQYMFKDVEVMVLPVTQPSLPASGPGYSFCHIVTDYDDATAPSTAVQLLSYKNLTILNPGSSHSRKFIPHCAMAAYSGAFTSYANTKLQWIDAASPSVQHYGIKITVTQSTSTNVNSWYVYVRYHIALKNQR